MRLRGGESRADGSTARSVVRGEAGDRRLRDSRSARGWCRCGIESRLLHDRMSGDVPGPRGSVAGQPDVVPSLLMCRRQLLLFE
jgi:hypothetical protein